jgi:hypothetical protein
MKIDRRAASTALATTHVAAALLLWTAVAGAQDVDACIGASESSLALRKAGKLLDARRALATCAAPACPDPVKTSCQQRLADLDRAVPSVVFSVKDGAGNDVPGVKITVDGQPRTERIGTALTLDPGEHTFTFEAAGLTPATKTLVIVEGVRERSETVVLGSPPAPAPLPPPTSPATPPATADTGSQSTGSTQRTLGYVAGGVGVAGLVAGGILGLMASSKWNTAQSEAYPQSSNDEHTASSLAGASTAAFVAGGVVAAAGIVLWLTAPRPSSPFAAAASLGVAPGVGAGRAALVVRGGF